MTWYEDAVQDLLLTEEAEGYLLGRGLCEWQIPEIGIGLWQSKDKTPCKDKAFASLYGERGEYFDNRLVIPIWGPRGNLLGWEARNWSAQDTKKLTQFLMPEAQWTPVFIGLTPNAMVRLWSGGDVWLTEGVYDMGAVAHIAPRTDTVLATLRAKVSRRHVEFFQRFLQGKVNMVYDNDPIGRRQTYGYIDPETGKKKWGALDSLSRVGIPCQDRPYKGGKDPGEVWETGGLPGLERSFNL